MTPRKPNSARRNTIKVILSNKIKTISSIFQGKHNLKKHLNILICGRGAQDLPNVYTHAIRGKFDLTKNRFFKK
jgi:ribosomal protein S12